MIALISGYILSWYMSSERGPSEQTSFAMWLSLCKHSHSFIGYGVQALGFWQIKLGLDIWGVTPKDQIDPGWFWLWVGMWIGFFLMIELFWTQKAHLRLVSWWYGEEMVEGIAAEDKRVAGAKKEEESNHKYLKSDFERKWTRLIQSLGKSYELYPLLTRAQFMERVANGCKWVRMRTLVFDVSHFVKLHPGGRGVLDAVVREYVDIEPLLNGTSSFQSYPLLKNTHSPTAWSIMEHNIVARLDINEGLGQLLPTVVPVTAASLTEVVSRHKPAVFDHEQGPAATSNVKNNNLAPPTSSVLTVQIEMTSNQLYEQLQSPIVHAPPVIAARIAPTQNVDTSMDDPDSGPEDNFR